MNAPLHVLHSDWQDAESFDEFQDHHMQIIAPDGLWKELQAVLTTRSQIKGVREWGSLDQQRAFEQLLEDVEKLYKACRDKWSDQ